MKKTIIVMLLLVATYLSATAFAGYSFNKHVGQLNQQLAANEAIRVNTLSYERGFFTGTLNYNIEYRWTLNTFEADPTADSTEPAWNWIQMEGFADVQHGPYVGRGGFALAKLTSNPSLPEQFHDFLPEHQKQSALLNLVTTIGFEGSAKTVFTGMNYDGSLSVSEIDPETTIAVLIDNWGGTLTIDSDFAKFDLSAHIGKISMSVDEDGALSQLGFSDLHFELVNTKRSDLLWTGDGRWTMDAIHYTDTANDEKADIQNLTLQMASIFKGDTFDNTLSLSTGAIKINAINLNGLKCDMTLSDVDVVAYESVVRLIDQDVLLGLHEQSLDTMPEAITQALNRFFAAGPTFTIDALSIHMVDADDISGKLKLHYPADAPFNMDLPAGMLEHVSIEGGISASVNALEKISHIYAETQSREQQLYYGEPMSTEEIAEIALQSFSQMMFSFHFMPFFVVSDESVKCNFEIRNGAVYANDELVFNLSDMI